jgi:hypothetical protein
MSKTGVPQYTENKDHILIAYMLAILGYILKFDHMFKMKNSDLAPIVSKATIVSRSIANIENRVDEVDHLNGTLKRINEMMDVAAPLAGFKNRTYHGVIDGRHSNLPPSERPITTGNHSRGGRRMRSSVGSVFGSRSI